MVLRGELLGTPWCYVNYFFGKCNNDHYHLVWQCGDKIYRDCLYQPGEFVTRAQVDAQKEVDRLLPEMAYIALVLASARHLGKLLIEGDRLVYEISDAGGTMRPSVDNVAYQHHTGFKIKLPFHVGGEHSHWYHECHLRLTLCLLQRENVGLVPYNEGRAAELPKYAKRLLDAIEGAERSADVLNGLLIKAHETHQAAVAKGAELPIKYKAAYDKITANLEQFYIAV